MNITKNNTIQFYILQGNEWRETKGNTLKKGHTYIKLYHFVNDQLQFKGIGIYKTNK